MFSLNIKIIKSLNVSCSIFAISFWPSFLKPYDLHNDLQKSSLKIFFNAKVVVKFLYLFYLYISFYAVAYSLINAIFKSGYTTQEPA